MNIAFLGLGNMGGPMAANLVAAGHTVHAFDPVPALKAAAEAKGGKVFDTGAAAVADADVVITSLPSGAIVKSCYNEVLPAAKAGALFIDTSTISVDDAREIHRQATDRGFAQLDAPVSGGVKGATAGTLAFMVGGEDEAVERARPVLEPLAGKIIHCGGSGNGQSAKLCNNMVLAVQQIAVGEAFVLAEKLGLSAQSLFDVITGATGNCWAVHTNCPVPGPVPASPANNGFKPGFATALMNKDLGLAMDAVEFDGLVGATGHPRRRNLCQVQRRSRRQGLQRCDRTTARQLNSPLKTKPRPDLIGPRRSFLTIGQGTVCTSRPNSTWAPSYVPVHDVTTSYLPTGASTEKDSVPLGSMSKALSTPGSPLWLVAV